MSNKTPWSMSHVQDGLPDLLDDGDAQFLVLLDVLQLQLAGVVDLAPFGGWFAGFHTGQDGVHNGVGVRPGAKFPRIDGDHDLGQADLVIKGADGVDGVSVGQHRGDQVQRDGQAAALPVAHGQHPPGLLDLGGIAGQLTMLVVAAGHRELHPPQAAVLDFAVAELADGAVDHGALAVGAGNGHNQGGVADPAVLAAPGGHGGHGVGPADAHTAPTANSQVARALGSISPFPGSSPPVGSGSARG